MPKGNAVNVTHAITAVCRRMPLLPR